MCALVTGVQTCALPISRAAYDDSRRLKFAKRPICGHARDVKFLDQLCFRRDAITRLQTPVANRIRYALLDRGIAWRSVLGGMASRRSVDSVRSEEHTSELQSLMRISYAVFCLKTKNTIKQSRLLKTTHDTSL